MEKIKNVIGLYVFTDQGRRLSVHEFENKPNEGDEVVEGTRGYISQGNGIDVDCPGGKCPVR